MSSRLPSALPPMEVNTLDAIELRPAKAGLGSQDRSIALCSVVRDTLIRHCGSLKAAAISMGQMDQGQLTRDLDSGKFKLERLEMLDDAAHFYTALGKELLERYGPLSTPKARGLQKVREIQAACAELIQAIEAA